MPTCAPRNGAYFRSRPICAPESRPNKRASEIAEVAVAQRAQEAVRQPERHLAFRQPQVGVERGDVEVRLRIVRIAIRIVVLRGRGVGRRAPDRPSACADAGTAIDSQHEREQEPKRMCHDGLSSGRSSQRLPAYLSCLRGRRRNTPSRGSGTRRPPSDELDRHRSPPRGTFLFTLNFLISMPCTPSPDVTTSLMRSPSVTSMRAGSKANRLRHDVDECGHRVRRRSRGGVLLVRHCCRPQQERRPRRGN